MELFRLSWNSLPWNFTSFDFPSVISIIESIVAILSVAVPLCVKFIRNNNINRDLKKWLSRETIKSLNCYVNTRGQQVDPSENDEIKKNQDFSFTKKLIPFFIKDVFKNKIPNQYYIILGDSGMGKTTFMIKLYKNYKQKWFKRFNIELIPLLYTNALTKIDEIKEKDKTILLLDGLDENPFAMKNYEAFMHELIDKTEMFHKVIITCRTQFFPNEKAEPYETGKIMFATENKNNVFYKIYISPFSNKDITFFLKKKYVVFKIKKRKKAKQIIKKCPYLMARPMLLSYIDDLIISKREYNHLFQVYEQLVENWIRREAVSSEALHSFTKQTAIKMYCNNSIYISSEEMEELCEKYNINLKNIEARSKSLLNRNGLGQYKFAHKSIYEYVLAKEVLQDADFREIYNFTNLDMARIFLGEMLEKDLKDALVAFNISYNFSRLHIKNVDFTGKNLIESIFNESVFEECKFSNCEMHNIRLIKCKFINCDMAQTNLVDSIGEDLQFDNCILIDAIFNQAILKGCEIIDSNISHSHFCNANISSSKFIKSNIAYSDLSNSIFIESVFIKMISAPLRYDNFMANSEIYDEIIMANEMYTDGIKEFEESEEVELQFINLG